MYEYKCKITSVYDGDTVTGDIDLGFYTFIHDQKFRLLGINTPEIRTKNLDEKKKGYLAKEEVERLILNKTVRIVSHGKGKYGRWLVEIFVDDMEISVNQHLINEGFAKEYLK